MKENTCAFAGLRPHKLPFEEGGDYFNMLNKVMKCTVEEAIDKGYTTFLSGGAMGADLWFAEIVLELRKENPALRLICILPCETQANSWPEPWRDRYFSVCAASDDVEYISHPYTKSCYFERNRALIDRSSLLIALHGRSTRGGTAYTIAYAKEKNVPAIILDPFD